jgi:hypothetical protein
MWRAEIPGTTVATNEVIQNVELKVSPNPARDYIEFQTDVDLPAGSKISIVSLDGKILMTRNPGNEKRFDVGQLATGVYILKVYDAKNATSIRFVVAR